VSVAIALFTRDLRVRDNPVLAAARAAGDGVVPLFVFDRTMLERTAHARPHRFGFLCQSLVDLDDSLRDRGAQLVVRRGDWMQEVMQVAYECRAQQVHVARDVSRFARRRLDALEQAATIAGIDVVVHDSVTVMPPDAFAKPYLVFTPYFKRWLDQPLRQLAPQPRRITMANVVGSNLVPDAAPPGEWVGGETAGLDVLKRWAAHGLARYGEHRDDLAEEPTSHISPYLHFGCLSPVEVVTRVRTRDGAEPFIRQLCWRDYAAQLTWFGRGLIRNERSWRDDPAALASWKEGRTGVRLVDAAMRQLLAEGWMPNRVRMLVASYLVKQLEIDWRAGAAHFMDLLVDGDVANNTVNWQWVVENRALSPARHAERFDRDGVYQSRWLA
jgi:deoxyribodipyrimidine photo-lyase